MIEHKPLGRQPLVTDQLFPEIANRKDAGVKFGIISSVLAEEGKKVALVDAYTTVFLREGAQAYLTPREVAIFELQARNPESSKRQLAKEVGVSRRTFNNCTKRAIREIGRLNPRT